MERSSLLVIIPDRLSALIAKGEVTSRYYNPGNLYDEVHIVMVNRDKPDPEAIQPMVGTARLHLHNIPIPYGRFFLKTLGWNPILMRPWAAQAVALAKEISPSLIRCHGNHHNAYLASEIKRELGVPYIISMHINPDADERRLTPWAGDVKKRFLMAMHRRVERHNMRHSDCVICVYDFIRPYAESLGARRIETIYNVINPDNLVPKSDYALGNPPRIIIPGRQFRDKDPSPVLRAVAQLPDVQTTLLGDGDYHMPLQELAASLGISNRCVFLKAMPNDELCKTMHQWDILVSVNDYGGVSKVELEASQIGMPVITNAHPMEDEPEILRSNCLTVSGSTSSYRNAIESLLNDHSLRQRLGENLRESVREITPEKLEAQVIDLYENIKMSGD